ncbi:MAG: long-chain fatty acid--CoA ligase [bacterium]
MKQNIIAQFLKTSELRGQKTCAMVKREGRWINVTWDEVARRVLTKAAALRQMGLKKGDRVALLVHTSLEWTIADCAIMAAGGISVPIYCSLTVDRIAHVLRDSAPIIAIVEDQRVARLFEEARQFDGIREMLLIGVTAGAAPYNFNELGENADPEEVSSIRREIELLAPEDAATYVYTSGTTGELKGVVITHRMIAAEIDAARQVFDFTPDEVGLVCLPLAHVLGRLMQFYQLVQGSVSAYAESFEKLAENYMEVRPHFVCGVPRMLEKIHEKADEHVAGLSPRARRLAEWALEVGRECSQLDQKRRRIPFHLAIKRILADFLFFRKLRGRLGGRLHTFICGGAKLPLETARFLHSAGMLVLEGYGLTETFAAVTVNRRDDYHFGTVGKPLPGVALKLAADGEILVKGPTVFREYLHRPDESIASFDSEGWFRTGDLGEYSRDGFLRIAGRKKDIIVTAGGKNIAPQMIESTMLASSFISNFMVYGDGQKYLTALVTLKRGEVLRFLRCKGLSVSEVDRLSEHPEVRTLIAAHIEDRNRSLARYETIKRFAILETDFSVATGELTPTLKIRREFTSAKYREVLESLYHD